MRTKIEHLSNSIHENCAQAMLDEKENCSSSVELELQHKRVTYLCVCVWGGGGGGGTILTEEATFGGLC